MSQPMTLRTATATDLDHSALTSERSLLRLPTLSKPSQANNVPENISIAFQRHPDLTALVVKYWQGEPTFLADLDSAYDEIQAIIHTEKCLAPDKLDEIIAICEHVVGGFDRDFTAFTLEAVQSFMLDILKIAPPESRNLDLPIAHNHRYSPSCCYCGHGIFYRRLSDIWINACQRALRSSTTHGVNSGEILARHVALSVLPTWRQMTHYDGPWKFLNDLVGICGASYIASRHSYRTHYWVLPWVNGERGRLGTVGRDLTKLCGRREILEDVEPWESTTGHGCGWMC